MVEVAIVVPSFRRLHTAKNNHEIGYSFETNSLIHQPKDTKSQLSCETLGDLTYSNLTSSDTDFYDG